MNKIVQISFLALLWYSHALTWATELSEDEKAMQYLENIDFSELLEVEVALDDVFDVFDGLVKQQKVKVASGISQSTATAPAVTSVITAQDIEVSGARSLAEVLRMVPGLHIATTSNYRPVYLLRGIGSSTNPEVLFLINGTPIKSPYSGNRGMFELTPELQHIARIEIIRGPGSAVYGADAFSGVINVITKTAQEIDGLEVGGRVGSYDTYETWILHGSRQGEVDIAASVQLKQTNGLDATIAQDTQSLIDAQMGRALPNYQPMSNAPGALNLGAKKLDTHLDLNWRKWRLSFDYTDILDQGVGMYVLMLDPLGKVDSRRYQADLAWHDPKLAEFWDVEAKFSYQQWKESDKLWYNPPGAVLPQGFYPDGVYQESTWHEDILHFETDVFYRGLSQHIPRFGVGASREESILASYRRNYGEDSKGNPIPAGSPPVDFSDSSYSGANDIQRDNWHVFLQDTWNFAPNWELTAGIRYDDYSDFGSATNPRAALVWQTTPHFTTKFLYGKAFRAPTFQEMHLDVPLLHGNLHLKPETIHSYELAFDWHTQENIFVALSLYHFDIKDKILPVLNISYPQYLNQGEWKGSGAEVELRWKLTNRSSVLFNYAYAESQIKMPTQQYRETDYPRQTAYLRLDWMFLPDWYVDGQAYWSADYARLPTDPRSKMNDNFSVDLTLRYKKARDWHWNVAIGVRNLLDAELREPSVVSFMKGDYPLGGRTGFVELRYKFK
jgi:iron complex outermembrane receptor protein